VEAPDTLDKNLGVIDARTSSLGTYVRAAALTSANMIALVAVENSNDYIL
jgi:hypothetical protein